MITISILIGVILVCAAILSNILAIYKEKIKYIVLTILSYLICIFYMISFPLIHIKNRVVDDSYEVIVNKKIEIVGGRYQTSTSYILTLENYGDYTISISEYKKCNIGDKYHIVIKESCMVWEVKEDE